MGDIVVAVYCRADSEYRQQSSILHEGSLRNCSLGFLALVSLSVWRFWTFSFGSVIHIFILANFLPRTISSASHNSVVFPTYFHTCQLSSKDHFKVQVTIVLFSLLGWYRPWIICRQIIVGLTFILSNCVMHQSNIFFAPGGCKLRAPVSRRMVDCREANQSRHFPTEIVVIPSKFITGTNG